MTSLWLICSELESGAEPEHMALSRAAAQKQAAQNKIFARLANMHTQAQEEEFIKGSMNRYVTTLVQMCFPQEDQGLICMRNMSSCPSCKNQSASQICPTPGLEPKALENIRWSLYRLSSATLNGPVELILRFGMHVVATVFSAMIHRAILTCYGLGASCVLEWC